MAGQGLFLVSSWDWDFPRTAGHAFPQDIPDSLPLPLPTHRPPPRYPTTFQSLLTASSQNHYWASQWTGQPPPPHTAHHPTLHCYVCPPPPHTHAGARAPPPPHSATTALPTAYLPRGTARLRAGGACLPHLLRTQRPASSPAYYARYHHLPHFHRADVPSPAVRIPPLGSAYGGHANARADAARTHRTATFHASTHSTAPTTYTAWFIPERALLRTGFTLVRRWCKLF